MKDPEEVVLNCIRGIKRTADLSPAKTGVRVVKIGPNSPENSPDVDEIMAKLRKCEIDPLSNITGGLCVLKPYAKSFLYKPQ